MKPTFPEFARKSGRKDPLQPESSLECTFFIAQQQSLEEEFPVPKADDGAVSLLNEPQGHGGSEHQSIGQSVPNLLAEPSLEPP
ncbi:MAG TPA: hypothetical protein DD435_10485, partial [Cyanobacteria bacterium UBA8530]|nr:hypothetical protein [Cyanobacteria bacterium UBA8530]